MLRRIAFSRRNVLSVLLLGCFSLAWAQGPPDPAGGKLSQSPDRVVISVDNEKMTSAEVEKFLQALPPQFRAYYGGPGKQLLPQYLVQLKILAAEARKENLQERPEIQQAIEIARTSILADAARKRLEQSIPVSDQQVQQLYQQRKAELEEVRIRRILIRTESSILTESASPTRPPLSAAEARKKLEDLRKQILAGASFAELAQTYSDDLATAGAGGDMGYINRQNVVPPIADAAFALSPGQVSDIIPTPYGLELIKVEDKRTKPLAEVRPELEAQIRQAKVQETLQQLVTQHRVVVDSQFFAPAVKTSAPAPSSPAAHP